jgi:hypothetical protein
MQGCERTITTHTGRRRIGHRAAMGRALLGASGLTLPGVHHRSLGGRSNRRARKGPGCYPSVTLRPRAGPPSTSSSGIPASVGNPPVLRRCLDEVECSCWGFGHDRYTSPRLREETPVSSDAVAFDLVIRESVWQRAGPFRGECPRGRTRAASWLARDGSDVGPPRWFSTRQRGGDRREQIGWDDPRAAPTANPPVGHSTGTQTP